MRISENIKIRQEKGFTLAEVLITLTIIGVIAALTIPALITNVQDAQLRTSWKSAASVISQATRKLATDNAGSLTGVFNNNNDVRDKLSNYLSYMQKCNSGNAVGDNGCWGSQTYRLSGANLGWWDFSQWSRIVLNNAVFLAFAIVSSPSNTCTYNRAAKQNACTQVAIDVNGYKGPNMAGKDIFFGFMTEDGSFEPFGKTGDYWANSGSGVGCDLNLFSNAMGVTCSAQYLYQ